MRNLIINIIIVLGLGCFSILQAQHVRGEVYLHSGQYFEGAILQQGVGQGVSIQVDGGLILNFEEKDIKKIVQRPGRMGRDKNGILVRQKGFYQRFAFGMGFTEKRNQWNGGRYLWGSPTLEAVSGLRFSPKVNAGLGLGLNFYEFGYSFAPLFIDFRGDWDLPGANRAVVPHYFVNLGYGLTLGRPWDAEMRVYRGGLFTHAGLGLKLRSPGRAEWTFTLGLRRQSSYQEYSPWNNPNTRITGTRHFQSLEAQLGFMF